MPRSTVELIGKTPEEDEIVEIGPATEVAESIPREGEKEIPEPPVEVEAITDDAEMAAIDAVEETIEELAVEAEPEPSDGLAELEAQIAELQAKKNALKEAEEP